MCAASSSCQPPTAQQERGRTATHTPGRARVSQAGVAAAWCRFSGVQPAPGRWPRPGPLRSDRGARPPSNGQGAGTGPAAKGRAAAVVALQAQGLGVARWAGRSLQPRPSSRRRRRAAGSGWQFHHGGGDGGSSSSSATARRHLQAPAGPQRPSQADSRAMHAGRPSRVRAPAHRAAQDKTCLPRRWRSCSRVQRYSSVITLAHALLGVIRAAPNFAVTESSQASSPKARLRFPRIHASPPTSEPPPGPGAGAAAISVVNKDQPRQRLRLLEPAQRGGSHRQLRKWCQAGAIELRHA